MFGLPLNRLFGAAGEVLESGVRFSKFNARGLGAAFIATDFAINMGTAKKGDVATQAAVVAGATAGGYAGGYAGKVAGGLIGSTFGPAGTLVGEALGGIVGGLLGDQLPRTAIYKNINRIKSGILNDLHLNAGGQYKDTEYAYTMRQRASSELSSSLLNARIWLGKEGLLYHT